MSTPTLPVEGAWSGGLTSDGFSVKARSDQPGNFTLDVSERPDFAVLIPTTPVALGQDAFFCGQVDVGGLNPATTYHWRVRLDDGAGNEVVGDVPSGTAGSVRTPPLGEAPFSFIFMGCNAGQTTQTDAGANQVRTAFAHALALNPDFHIHADDVYYCDIGPYTLGTGQVGIGAWYGHPGGYEELSSFAHDTLAVSINVVGGNQFVRLDGGSYLDEGFIPGERMKVAGFQDSGTNGWNVIDSVTANTITAVNSVANEINSDDGQRLISGYDRYHLNFIGTYGGLSLDYGAWDSRSGPVWNSMRAFKAAIPGKFMFGDHDRAYDNCSGRAEATGADKTTWDMGRDAAHATFMGLNRRHIEAEGRTFIPYVSDEHYFVVDDWAPLRIIVTDTVSHKDDYRLDDAPEKQFFGETQEQWIFDRIADNPHDFLCIVSGHQLDGNHGFFIPDRNTDNMRGYAYSRDRLEDHIRQYGNPRRTFFLTGDTHNLGLNSLRGKTGKEPPIYEFCAGQIGWGFDDPRWTNGLRTGATGRGTWQERMFVGGTGFVQVVHRAHRLDINLYSATDVRKESDAGWGHRILVSRTLT